MAYVAKSTKTGLYYGGGMGGKGESFCVFDPSKAVVFGDAHRSFSDLESDEGREFIPISCAESCDEE